MHTEAQKLPGGPTQDEVLAISLSKLRIRPGDLMLDLGCGTGKVAITAAGTAGRVVALDSRAEAIGFARKLAEKNHADNIEFRQTGAEDFFKKDDRIFDCAFVGGTRGIAGFLPVLIPRVRRTIIVNAVLLSTLYTTVETLQKLGAFREAVHIQVSCSKDIAGSIMFRPIDPVYVIVGAGRAC